MFTFLDNKKGYAALIGLLLVVLIIGLLTYGGSFFSKEKGGANTYIETGKQAEEMIAEIELNTGKKQDELERATGGEKNEKTSKSLNINISDGDELASPLLIRGNIASADNMFLDVELRNSEHETLVNESVVLKKSSDGGWVFAITINFEFNNTKEGYVAVTNGEEDLVELSVKFTK